MDLAAPTRLETAAGEPPGRSPLDRLGALLEKYDLLIALRRAAPGRTEARRRAMQTLAARFPAALREWDVQPLEELVRRRHEVALALAQARDGADVATLGPDWLRYGLDLHAHLREVLLLRRWLLARRARAAGDPRGPARFAVDSAQQSGAPFIDEETLRQCQRFYDRQGEPVWPGRLTAERLSDIASPPGGRLAALAYADVAAHHGVSVAAIKQALFQPVGRDPTDDPQDRSDDPPADERSEK